MAVDPNEITGFVLSCVNEGWLLALERLCRERIEALASLKQKPVQPGPARPVVQHRPELAEHLRRPPAHPDVPVPPPIRVPAPDDESES